jgi:DNA-binding response OmpR family regulator
MAKILIVEDTEDILEMLSFIIQRQGHQVFTATCKTEALAVLRTTTPELILMDVMLKDEDGRLLCKDIKSTNPGIKIILLSASPGKLKDYKKFMADDKLEKPFDIDTFLDKINYHLEQIPVTDILH